MKAPSIVGLVGGFLTHQSFLVGMYKWLFDNGWVYPFYSGNFLVGKTRAV